MSTKILLGSSAVVMGAAGIAGSFLPQEMLAGAGIEASRIAVLVVQLYAGLLFGFAMVNWMARGSLIGGIYNRPVAVGNVAHFTIGALALLKAIGAGEQALVVVAPAVVYTAFAAGFALVLFRSPVKNAV